MKIEVMILGEKGSGKTLLLAGLHGALGTAQMELPLTLEVAEPSRTTLNNVYSQAIQPDNPDFPPSTPWGVEEWLFQCVILGADNTPYSPFSVVYTDYDGTMINPNLSQEQLDADPGMQKFFEREESAHAFLILIDGHRMFRLLQGDSKLTHWLDTYLPRVLQIVTRGRPVHLVVTKWAILEKAGISLQKVRDTLLAQKTLKGVAASLGRRGVLLRLIPVDVFGPFAQLNDEGMMVKVPQASVVPINLAVPFAALLPDIIKQKYTERTLVLRGAAGGTTTTGGIRRGAQVGEQVVRQLVHLLQRNRPTILREAEDPLVNFLSSLLSHTGRSEELDKRRVETVRNAVHETLVFIDRYFEQAEEQLIQQQEKLRRVLDDRQATIDKERAAVELAIAGCTARLREFERQYPGSLLHVS